MWKYALPIGLGVLLVAMAFLFDRLSEGKPLDIPWILLALGGGFLLAMAFAIGVAVLGQRSSGVASQFARRAEVAQACVFRCSVSLQIASENIANQSHFT